MLEAVERRLVPALRLHPADVADQPHQAAGLLDLHRLARRAHRDRGLGDRTPATALAQLDQSTTSRSERPIQSARSRAEPPGLARRLDDREPDARRRAGAERA